MPGPAPKSNEQRRRRNTPRANTVRLPAEGRQGPTPVWPFSTITPAGWAEIWSRPQAVMWEVMGAEKIVARYVDLQSKIADPAFPESSNASFWAALSTLEDRLGLSPMSMMKLQWEIAGTTVVDDVPDGEAGDDNVTAAVTDIRQRAGFGGK